MKKIYVSIVCCFLLYLAICCPGMADAQSNPLKLPVKREVTKNKFQFNWKNSPFDHCVFIENKGQFDGIISSGDKVLYAAQIGKVMAYFTAHGVTYKLKEYLNHDGARSDPDENPGLPVFLSCSATWEGSNPDVSLQPGDKLPSYYTYPIGAKGTTVADVFRRIKYVNLYPGIDAEYFFPKGKQGIEYTLTVHPGADLSEVKLIYKGVNKMSKNANGDVIIESDINELTDHAPIANIEGDFSPSVPVSYQVEGNMETFRFSELIDKSKTIIIDPWTTNPNFTSYDKAYDLDFDNAGNVYVYGGTYTSSYQLVKFNSFGVIQWTFNASLFATEWYGDLVVDHHSENTYLVEGFNSAGAQVLKVSPAGLLLGTFPGNPNLQEMWRAVYDACNDSIVIGCGGTNAENQACMLDTNLTTIAPVNILGATTALHDIAFICMDPSGRSCYMASARSAAYPTVLDNVVCQLPVPNLSPTTYVTPDNFTIEEVGSISYVSDLLGAANGMNGMAASPNWLYMYDGKTLKQLFKNTGQQNDSNIISTTSFQWGGLAVDPCDDIFLGCQDSLKVYNSSLGIDTAIRMPNTIYDVVLGQHNLLYLCGDSFVCAVTVPAIARLISTASGIPTSCSACNGSASVTINCGVSPYSFRWSNGETTQTDTGLCAGIYTVTVTDASCPPRIDTALVNVPGEAGFTASTVDSNPNCALSLGNATVYPNGGVSPYTYSWSNGETSQQDTGLVAGNYTCTITDNTGCRYSVIVNLINPVTPTITIVPNNDSICSGTNLSLTASGVSTYAWTPNTGLSCYTCPTPMASPTATTTYTVMGADSNGCTATATTTIKVYTTPKPVITGKDSICTGSTDTLSVTGGTTYTWSTGATTSSIVITVTSNQTVIVTAKNGICTHDTSFTVIDVSNAARITASRDSACAGDTVKLTGSGGLTYRWSTSSTNPVIIVSPTIPTTYTLYTAYGSCTDSAIVKIGIIKQAEASLSISADSVCPGTNVTLTATLTNGIGTFKWSSGATTSTISVNDSVTTTYTATVYGKCDTVSYTITNKIVPLPKLIITGQSLRCHGEKDTLTVTGGTTYVWSNGSTKSTYITGDIDADSTISLIAYNSLNCPDSAGFQITIRNAPTITISKPPTACTGDSVELVPTVSGTGPYTFSWSPNGQTTDSIRVPSPADSSTATYTAFVSNGCTSSKTITITAEYPVLYAVPTQTVTLINDTISPAFVTLWANGNSIKYFWQDSLLVTCVDPTVCDTVRVSPSVTTTYTVTGYDKAGCEVSGYVTVVVDVPCFDFKVPNVFTPNYPGVGGKDNMLYIETENIDGWSMTIFDRWGKEMYSSTDLHQYWNGTNKNGDQATDGVYYYIITGVCKNNTYKKEGFVQLIR